MKKENSPIIITSIISGVVLLIAVIAIFAFQPQTSNVVTVQGVSTVKAMPDLITVYYSIETDGNTSAAAKDANTLIYNKLTDALVAQGFSKDDLKTENFNIYPNTYWDNGKEKQDGYKASHSLKIELSVNESDKLTTVIDAGANSGAAISYINFELTQKAQNEYKAQALQLAAQDAQIKAESVANGFDKKAGKLVSIQVSDFGYYPWNIYTSRAVGGSADVASAKESTMNITPSEQDVTATISATFKIQ
ncbi:Uncharacterised protein [uncultured archaeon]|nr:Uncharacterised protein [uncultured archaeon]